MHLRVVQEAILRAVKEGNELHQVINKEYGLGNRAVGGKEQDWFQHMSGIPKPENEDRAEKRP